MEFPLLNGINGPRDLKQLPPEALPALAEEIRGFLIQSLSETGGHLASNLGVVELTLALHYVFDPETDRLVWDVGHQSYVHKLLSGRRDAFPTLRKIGGLSGFPKGAESVCDAFDTGHASTAVSAALGLAVARDLSGGDYHVIAVAGDGSMTGGLAYEAMNNAGQLNTKLIVILNDNGMSISKSVGAVSRYMSNLRTKGSYLRVKRDVKAFLERIPLVGKSLATLVYRAKTGVKRVLVGGGLFDVMGFNYIGPIDGHDLKRLTEVLSRVKAMEGPILLHVRTVKGKGYGAAEDAPARFHGVGAFNVETGVANTDKLKITYSDIFGYTLTTLAKREGRIAAITAAMPDGTGLLGFQKAFPERFFDVGIAEGHAVTFAAGLAKGGLIPVLAVYSTFLQRGYDQIIHDVCLQNLHVVFAVDRAGIVGADGETHQGVFDLAFFLHMPNISVMCPKDGRELEDMMALAVEHPGPVALRYPREKATAAFEGLTPAAGNKDVAFSKAERLLAGEGKGLAVVSLGTMAEAAFAACKGLEALGCSPALYNARFAKPIDKAMLEELKAFDNIVTIEDGCAPGGFGAALTAELYGSLRLEERKPQVRILAFPDRFIEHGKRNEIMSLYGMDADGVFKALKGLAGL